MAAHHPSFPASLRGKLAPPATAAAAVERPELVDRICNRPGAKLAIVRAPAGFGKTTLLEQCRIRMAATGGIATAWLTLDASDNDISHFLTCLSAAIAGIVRGGECGPRSENQIANKTTGDITFEVLESLARIDQPFCLFLDDFEFVHEPGVLGIVRQIVDQLPPRGMVVIASRTSPELGLGRLRVRGLLQELQVEDLRFSLEETRELLLGQRRLTLDGAELAELHRRTEGWPAALWLALLALERQGDRRSFLTNFSGVDESLGGYLTEVVLDRQPEPVRRFLLYTSILRQLNGPLCAALLPGEDCEAMLKRIGGTDIPLSPLEGMDGSYRYHSLFAGFLRACLDREAPEEIPRLHRAASAWYESQGRPVPAIDHAIEAGDHANAIELLRRHGRALLAEGRVKLLEQWCKSLPAEMLREHLWLRVIQIWAVCYAHGPAEAAAILDESGLETAGIPELRSYVMPLRPILLAMMDRVEEAHLAARQCIAQMANSPDLADPVMIFIAAAMEANIGEHAAARELLEEGRRLQAGAVTPFAVLHAETIEGQIDLHEGRLRQAQARFRMALDITRQVGRQQSSGNAWAGVLYAGALYELDELEEARRLLQVYAPLVKDLGLVDHVILAHLPLVRIAFLGGDSDKGHRILGEMEYFGRQRKLSRVVAAAKIERSRVLLLQGHAAAAQEALDLAEDPALWTRVDRLRLAANELDDLTIARLRWTAIAGDAHAAIPELEEVIAQASSASRHHRALKLKLLKAMALSRDGEPDRALRTMGDVLKKTFAEGFFRLIVDEGIGAGRLIQQCAAHKSNGGRAEDPLYPKYLERLLAAFHLPSVEGDAATLPFEPLTHKEIHVLTLLADGHSDAMMAERLFLSTSTVRSHLRNIYSKLDVNNRMKAVLSARRAGII